MAERLSVERECVETSGLLLAVESATRHASVALTRANEVVAERVGRPGDHHAEQLLPMIDAVLREAGAPLAEVAAFAISIGPGAFTSLRIGLATVKGLAFGSAVPVIPVSTLACLAQASGHLRADASVLALPDARRGEAYCASYTLTSPAEGDPDLRCVIEDGVRTPAEIACLLEGSVQLVGEGAALFGEAIVAAAPARTRISGQADDPAVPTARAVATLGRRAWLRGETSSAEALVPRYVRRAEAEVQRTEQRFE